MIIGITGSFGAGKGEVVNYLVETRGFKHYSASGFITEEILRRGLSVNRDSMIEVSNDLRKTHSPAYIVEALYKKAEGVGGDSVIEALRAVAEVNKIKELGGFVIGVDADSKIRYERAFKRGSAKDNVTYEQFLDQEQREINPDDPTKQNVFEALKQSNAILQNNGSLDELHAQIDEILKKIQ